jgi:hypothetical protein
VVCFLATVSLAEGYAVALLNIEPLGSTFLGGQNKEASMIRVSSPEKKNHSGSLFIYRYGILWMQVISCSDQRCVMGTSMD